MPYLQKYQQIDTGWKIKPWVKIDLLKLKSWYCDLEKKYGDWKFTYGKHKHMWQHDPGDLSGANGHIFTADTSWYTLCHNSSIAGPLPPERSMSLPHYQDIDDQQLNPRACFNGYGLDIVRNLPVRSKRVVVSITPPGTRLALHQDQPDKLRFHVTIKTNNKFKWVIDGEDIDIPEDGWIYLVNTSLPHYIHNTGDTNRISMYGKVWTSEIL